jgi:hypothetical protein
MKNYDGKKYRKKHAQQNENEKFMTREWGRNGWKKSRSRTHTHRCFLGLMAVRRNVYVVQDK